MSGAVPVGYLMPPIPADTDLRSVRTMPLDAQSMRDSGLIVEPPEVFRVAVLSWCVAWHQVPAGSLPDDDRMLARLLGFRDAGNMRRFRDAGKLPGWVRHNDGRLYHPTVTEMVLRALRHGGK